MSKIKLFITSICFWKNKGWLSFSLKDKGDICDLVFKFYHICKNVPENDLLFIGWKKNMSFIDCLKCCLEAGCELGRALSLPYEVESEEFYYGEDN